MKNVKLIIASVLFLFSSLVLATPPTTTITSTLTGDVGTGVYVTSGVNGAVTQVSNASLTNVVGAQTATGIVSGTGINGAVIDVGVNGLTVAAQTAGSASSASSHTSGTYSSTPAFVDGINAYASGAAQVSYTSTPTVTVATPAPSHHGDD